MIMMAAAPSLAEPKYSGRPESDENVIAADGHPWSAIGKLNNGAFGSCTAVLISSD